MEAMALTFWDFANANPAWAFFMVFFTVEGVVSIVRALCKKREPYECEDKKEETD